MEIREMTKQLMRIKSHMGLLIYINFQSECRDHDEASVEMGHWVESAKGARSLGKKAKTSPGVKAILDPFSQIHQTQPQNAQITMSIIPLTK